MEFRDFGGKTEAGNDRLGLHSKEEVFVTFKEEVAETHRDEWTVYVQPKLVVETAYNDLQESPRYPGRLALRFARVRRYREDKTPSEADTIQRIQAMFEASRK